MDQKNKDRFVGIRTQETHNQLLLTVLAKSHSFYRRNGIGFDVNEISDIIYIV